MRFLNKRNRFTRKYSGSFLSFPSYEKFSESRLYEYATPGISILDFILPYPNPQSLSDEIFQQFKLLKICFRLERSAGS